MWINPLRATVMITALLVGGAYASDGVDDILRLQRAGVSEDVQLAFIQNSTVSYDPSAIELETMERDGVSATVMVAMIDRGRAVRAEPTATSSNTSAPVDTAATAPNAPNYPTQPTGSPIATETASTVYAPPAEDTNISFFYEAMSPHGQWVNHSEYGYVFQPTVVVQRPDWRPYVDNGRWVWTDQGWYWHSDLDWGWAPFHYGRWAHDDRYTWVWVPDNQWGPAWVNWRQSDDYYGWAPLPPRSRFEAGIGFSFHDRHVGLDFNFNLGERDYAFVPADRFLDRDYRRVIVPRDRVRNVYNNTTIVNNTYVYNDNRIINNGIPRERVERRTNRRLETVRVREERVEAGRPIPHERESGNELAVYRPQVKEAAPVTPQAAIQRRELRMQQRQENVQQRQQVTQTREQAQAAAKQRLEQEKVSRAANRTEKVQERANERTANQQERQQNAAEREAAVRQRAEQEKAQREQEQTQRQSEAQQRQATQQAEREKNQERQQNAAEREAAVRQRAEQEKAERQQNQAKQQNEVQERQRAQESAKSERQENAAERQQREQAQEAQRSQAAQQRQVEAQARQQAQERAKAERQQNASERQQQAQERQQERQQRNDSPAPKQRGRDRD